MEFHRYDIGLFSLILALIVFVISNPLKAQPTLRSEEGFREVVMMSPQGDLERFTSRDRILQDKGTRHRILNLGVSENERQFLCNGAEATEWRMSRQLETQLELGSMIESLRLMRKPRQLSSYQKEILGLVPLCKPFLVDLKTIAQLLRGYELKKIRTKRISKND